jgi:hypothetical protein
MARKKKKKKKKKQKRPKKFPPKLPAFRVRSAMGEEDGLEEVVRQAVKSVIDNPTKQCKDFLQSVIKLQKARHKIVSAVGYLGFQNVKKSLLNKRSTQGLEREIFSSIPKEKAEEHLVTGTFGVDLSNCLITNTINVDCYHLLTRRIPRRGTGYFGGAKVTINRIPFNLYFMSHAIHRLRERVFNRLGYSIGSCSQTYGILIGENPLVVKRVEENVALVNLYVLTDLAIEGACYWKIAYAPCVLERKWAGAKTILAPGMKQTPERQTVLKLSAEMTAKMEAHPYIFSVWLWLNGYKDMVIDSEGKSPQPPRIDLSPDAVYDLLKKDARAGLESLGVNAAWKT